MKIRFVNLTLWCHCSPQNGHQLTLEMLNKRYLSNQYTDFKSPHFQFRAQFQIVFVFYIADCHFIICYQICFFCDNMYINMHMLTLSINQIHCKYQVFKAGVISPDKNMASSGSIYVYDKIIYVTCFSLFLLLFSQQITNIMIFKLTWLLDIFTTICMM
jgi:hypothetical protein